MKNNNLKAIVLAGGIGKRFWPITTYKSLLSFLGKPLTAFIFEDLKKAGIKDFAIVCQKDYKKNLVELFSQKGVKVEFFIQKKPKGMADALLCLSNFDEQPVMVLNSNDLFSPSFFEKFLKFCWQSPSSVNFAGLFQEEYFPGGYFVLKNQKVMGIIEKPPVGKTPSNFVKLVVDYFPAFSLLLNYLKKVKKGGDDQYERALDLMIKENLDLKLFKYKGEFCSLKYPWDILKMQKLLLNHRLKKEEIILEKGVKIMPTAIIKGPAYIGKNTIIGDYALVRESIIGENCLVGFGSEVARSYVGNNCLLHHNYIGDSVLEEQVNFGFGAVAANWRLDQGEVWVKTRGGEKISTGMTKLGAIIGKNVSVGVNASIMPGKLIGGRSLIGPGKVVRENLREETRFL